MALVSVTLRLDTAVKDAIIKGGEAQVQMAASLKAILDKLNEPDPGGDDEAELQARIDAITAALKESNDKLEAAGQQPVPPPAPSRLSRSS